MRKIKVYNDAVVLLLIALHYTYKNSTENKKKIKKKRAGTKGDDGRVKLSAASLVACWMASWTWILSAIFSSFFKMMDISVDGNFLISNHPYEN